jgi:ectoine hydroxylase-related dioxygenase (phytanoyl-CoA dioxygenase family)
MLKNQWEKDGYVILHKAIPHAEIDSYIDFWNTHHSKNGEIINKYGWDYFTCYINHSEIRNMLCHNAIVDAFSNLGHPKVGLHLAFTYFYSRDRSWHRDVTTENTNHADNYFAISIALEDIDETAGPLVLIPGSHKWKMDNSNAYKNDPSNPDGLIDFIKAVDSRDPHFITHTPQKGDVIIWHGHLIHKVIPATDPFRSRKVLIGHYGSGISGMLSPMPIRQHKNGWYFQIEENEEIRKKNFTIRDHQLTQNI